MAVLGGGLTVVLNDRMSFFSGYDVQLGQKQAVHVGTGGFRIVW